MQKTRGAAANAPTGKGSARLQVEEIPWPPPRVGSPLSQDLDFIKVGCHLGKYITIVMNTEDEQEDIWALQDDLDSASL
jgi:hypothetical protein